MKRNTRLAWLLCAALLLAACAKQPASAAPSQAAPSQTAASSQKAPPQETPPQPERTEAASPQPAPAEMGAGGLLEHEDVRHITDWVPYIAQYLQEGKLWILEEDFGDEVYAQGERCRIVTLEGEDGVRRRFACGVEEPFLFEFDEAACEWFQQFPSAIELPLEEVREYLGQYGFLAGYSYIGGPEMVYVDPQDPERGFSLTQWDRIAPAARAFYPWLDAIDEGRRITKYGSEYYVVVPADPMASVSVNSVKDGAVEEVLYRSETGEPIILRAGNEEHRIEITVVDSAGKVLRFSPLRRDGMFDALYDEENGESPAKFGFEQNLPMGGNVQLVIDALVERDASLAGDGYEVWVDPEEIVEIGCRPCLIVDLGHWYGNEFHPYERYAVSDDYRHVFTQDASSEWREVFGDLLVCAAWEADSPFERGEYAVFTAAEGEPQAEIAFWARGPIKDFQVLALTFEDVDENGNLRFAEQVLNTRELVPGRPLLVKTVFYGDLPNNGIAYTDESGVRRRFALSISGMDGSLDRIEY